MKAILVIQIYLSGFYFLALSPRNAAISFYVLIYGMAHPNGSEYIEVLQSVVKGDGIVTLSL